MARRKITPAKRRKADPAPLALPDNYCLVFLRNSAALSELWSTLFTEIGVSANAMRELRKLQPGLESRAKALTGIGADPLARPLLIVTDSATGKILECGESSESYEQAAARVQGRA